MQETNTVTIHFNKNMRHKKMEYFICCKEEKKGEINVEQTRSRFTCKHISSLFPGENMSLHKFCPILGNGMPWETAT